MLPGQVEDHGVRLDTGQHIAAQIDAGMPAGSKVLICVRPEKLRLRPTENGDVRVDGTVVESVYLGTATNYIVELSPGVRLVAIESNDRTATSEQRLSRGSKVTVGWLPEHGRVLRS